MRSTWCGWESLACLVPQEELCTPVGVVLSFASRREPRVCVVVDIVADLPMEQRRSALSSLCISVLNDMEVSFVFIFADDSALSQFGIDPDET